MNDDQAASARQLASALCDDQRLIVAGRLAERGWTVLELSTELDIKPQSLMRHIRALGEAGLFSRSTAQPERLSFDVERLRSLATLWRPEDDGDDFEGETAEDAQFLRRFFKGNRILKMPVQRSHRLLVLRWLADRFEYGRDYPETEVNELLAKHDEDFALLRRELVDEGLMRRSRGIYRRTGVSSG